MPDAIKVPIQTKAPVAVVGVGNWLVSYDRIGPLVLNLCEGRYGPDVELFDAGSAGLALLDCIDAQDLMLVVDACRSNGTPGKVRVAEMDVEAHMTSVPGLHQIGPLETLVVARHLFPEKLPRRLLFLLVETDGLSDDDLEQTGQRVVALIDEEIARYRNRRLSAH